MHEYSRAQKAYEEARMIDPSNQEARDGLLACMRDNDPNTTQSREQAMQDPEIRQILADPSMRLILEQMSTDPGAAKEHIKNPDIRAKLLKLEGS